MSELSLIGGGDHPVMCVLIATTELMNLQKYKLLTRSGTRHGQDKNEYNQLPKDTKTGGLYTKLRVRSCFLMALLTGVKRANWIIY